MDIQKVDDYYDLLLGQETGKCIRIMAIKEILSQPEKLNLNLKKGLYKQIPTFTVEIDEL